MAWNAKAKHGYMMTTDPVFFSALDARVRERFIADFQLGSLSWLRTGGRADWLFQPEKPEDLQAFLKNCPEDIPIHIMGVGSNTIFRDGGVSGVVIRLGRGFMEMNFAQDCVTAGAGVLDKKLATEAAIQGLDLGFLRTIPGNVGGAVAMNAGCYGAYVADVLDHVTIMTRSGEIQTIEAGALDLAYRKSNLPQGAIILEATFCPPKAAPEIIEAYMENALQKRAMTQPVKERSCGSTFRNPAGYSSTGQENDDQTLKAWKLIDEAGLRGVRLGGAEMSSMHPNFLVNRENATAFDLEALGEQVRHTVFEHSGHRLEWEIARVGRFASGQNPDWL